MFYELRDDAVTILAFYDTGKNRYFEFLLSVRPFPLNFRTTRTKHYNP